MNIRRTLRVAVLAAVLTALLCAPALAKVVSPGTDFYYLDNANVLSEALEGEIYFSNQLLCEACGAQIVVVTVDSTGGERIDDYAYDLFNDWDIGDAEKQNGMLILLAIGDDDYYVEPGTGLQSKFSAGTINEYYDKYLETDFAAGNYESGVKKFFEAVFARVADTYNANVTTRQGVAAYESYIASDNSEFQGSYGGYRGSGRYGRAERADDDGGGLGFIVFILIIVLIIVTVRRGSRRRAVRRSSIADQAARMYVADRIWRGAHTPPRYTPAPPRPPRSYRSSGFSAGGSIFGGGSSSRSSSGSSSRPSSGGGFGGARGGGGGSRGGGAGRGRH